MFHLLLIVGSAVSAVYGQTCSSGCVAPNQFNMPVTQGIKARFDSTPTIGETYYFDIPRTLEEAKQKGYKQYPRPGGSPDGLEDLELYCGTEKNLCALLDDTGYIAGLQYALNIDRYTDVVFKPENEGFQKWSVDGQDYWVTQQYFVTKEFLKTSSADRIASRTNATLQLDGIWVTAGANRSLLHVPGTAAAMEAAGFVKQACVQGQGLHYAYKPQSIDCTGWLPWVPIVYNGKLTGCIFANLGRFSRKTGERYWFESTSARVLRLTLPELADCMVDLVDKNGIVTMHTFYFGNPWTVSCCPAAQRPNLTTH